MNEDIKLEICPLCNEMMCLKNFVTEDIFVKQCINCGMQTNSLLIENSAFYKSQMEMLPLLYQDLKQIDKDGCVWIPNVINVPRKGIVFVGGTNKFDWEWEAMKATKIHVKERKNYNNAKYKMDNKSLKKFGKEGFLEAVKYIGVQL